MRSLTLRAPPMLKATLLAIILAFGSWVMSAETASACYYHGCQQTIVEQPEFVQNGGFSNGVSVLVWGPTSWIVVDGVTYTNCKIANSWAGGSVHNGYYLPNDYWNPAVPECQRPVEPPIPEIPQPPLCGWWCPPPGGQVPPPCGWWNNCQPPSGGDNKPWLPYPQTPGECLNLGNIRQAIGGDGGWSVISDTNGEGLVYDGPAADLTGPLQGRLDVPGRKLRFGETARGVTNATYWCHG